jgi:hypothetical protein
VKLNKKKKITGRLLLQGYQSMKFTANVPGNPLCMEISAPRVVHGQPRITRRSVYGIHARVNNRRLGCMRMVPTQHLSNKLKVRRGARREPPCLNLVAQSMGLTLACVTQIAVEAGHLDLLRRSEGESYRKLVPKRYILGGVEGPHSKGSM